MYYESGMFPILFAAETSTNPTTTDPGPIANGGELPPPPNDPPKA
jgi:hypothetical protein